MLKVIEVALGEVGYLEKANNSQLDDKIANAGYGNWTKYARDLDELGVYNFRKNGFDWCDMFVDWCMITAYGVEMGQKLICQPMGGLGAGCTYSAQYYREKGQFHTSNPQPGDQIFFSSDGGKSSYHTGLVERADANYVYTIEGNTYGASGVIANGGGVCRKRYALNYSQIAGYGRPDYSMIEEEEDMDKERFKELWLEMRKDLQDNDANNYSKEAREWAVNNGIVQGGSANEFNGMWEDVLTREQMVTLLYRFAKLVGQA